MKLIGRLYLLLCLLSAVACHSNIQESLPVYETIEDLNGRKVGTLTGCFQEELLEKEYPELEVLRIDHITDLAQACKCSKQNMSLRFINDDCKLSDMEKMAEALGYEFSWKLTKKKTQRAKRL